MNNLNILGDISQSVIFYDYYTNLGFLNEYNNFYLLDQHLPGEQPELQHQQQPEQQHLLEQQGLPQEQPQNQDHQPVGPADQQQDHGEEQVGQQDQQGQQEQPHVQPQQQTQVQQQPTTESESQPHDDNIVQNQAHIVENLQNNKSESRGFFSVLYDRPKLVLIFGPTLAVIGFGVYYCYPHVYDFISDKIISIAKKLILRGLKLKLKGFVMCVCGKMLEFNDFCDKKKSDYQ